MVIIIKDNIRYYNKNKQHNIILLISVERS